MKDKEDREPFDDACDDDSDPNRDKKQKFSLMHKLANRWHTISNTIFCLHFGHADGS